MMEVYSYLATYILNINIRIAYYSYIGSYWVAQSYNDFIREQILHFIQPIAIYLLATVMSVLYCITPVVANLASYI